MQERPHWDAILEQAPRVLGLMDREALSPTAGCCDRTYWAWKFVDFPGARFQESLCVLGFFYATQRSDNPFYKNANLLEWIGRGLEYWCSIQYSDGSFDEAYPHEHSLAATAFTTFYVSEGLRFVGSDLPANISAKCNLALRKAGDWLTANDESHGFLSNHLAAAAAALLHVSLRTGDPRYAARSRYFVEKILSHQSSEGWFEEYGGADPGYQTHGSFYLARIHALAPNPQLRAAIERSMRFLAHFIHPDDSLGGEYASRNTQTYYPAAFEMLAPELPIAAAIAQRMRPAVKSASAAGLRSVDAYNYFPFLNNLVFAHLAQANAEASPQCALDEDGDGLRWWPDAGIARVRRGAYEAYVGTRKGGVLKVFDRRAKKLVYNDCGYIGRMRSGQLCSSQYEDREREVDVREDRITVHGAFAEIPKPIMTPPKLMAFRAFTITAGQVPTLARWMKNVLVKTLIYKKKTLPLTFLREIEFLEDRIVVRDRLGADQPNDVRELRWEPVFTTIHMGSSRYFIPNELTVSVPEGSAGAQSLDPKALVHGIRLERTIHVP